MTIQIPIVKPWLVQLPVVYRYMDQKYIDEFFVSGKLRLSSFDQFSKHPDEQRQDRREGVNTQIRSDSSITVAALICNGANSLIFCTSTLENYELMKMFKCNGCFKIKDSTAFGAAIAGSIAGFQEGLEGCCDYNRASRIHQKRVEKVPMPDLNNKPDGEPVNFTPYSIL